MIRQFYITIKAIEPLTFLTEPEVIEILLKESDVKSHLTDKLFTYNNRNDNKIIALIDFYLSLDTEHQIMFDSAVNAMIEDVNSRTVQY